MIRDRSFGSRLFDACNYCLMGVVGLLCIFPLIHIVAVSLSGRAATVANLVTFWPVGFTTLSYQEVFKDGQFLRSLLVSVIRVLAGTTINMLVVVLTAYPLALQAHFSGKQFFKWLLLFAMLFQGGLIPWYLALRSLNLLDTLWALILPGMVQVFSIIVMVNFFRRVPPELAEAAVMDGASHWHILLRIFLPLSVPALATLTLFAAVDHWNAWFDALIVMRTPTNYPLQTYLSTTIVVGDFSRLLTDAKTSSNLSMRSLRAAQIVCATIPILMLYPFLQRYFVSGLTIGAVKG